VTATQVKIGESRAYHYSEDVRYAESLLDLVGNTPLVRLSKTTDGAKPLVLAKVEYFNPGGSVKDRIAVRMIEAAEASGELKPGGTIVEPTSGNTGVGLAMVAQQKGYKCVFVCPDKVSEDKRNVLKAYGAEVVVCPTAVAPEHPDSYYNVSDRLVREIEGAWKPNQYANQNNPRSHYETTGPEIWEQTEGRITHFVAGVGTGGTISGTGKYLKEVSGGKVQIIGADPEGSVYSGGTGRPYLVEGVGEDFWPETYDRDICDRVIEVSDADSFALTRRLAREEAMLVGGSAGMAAAAAIRLAHELDDPDAVIVVLLPDGGRGYLTKVFNDDWLAQYGFLAHTRQGRKRSGHAFALLGGQEIINTWVLSMDMTPVQFMILAQIIIFLLGWPLEWTEIIVIFMPIFIPLLPHFHIDPLFFGLLVALNLQTAFLSPPVAMAAFYLKGVSPPHVTLNAIFAGMMPFMAIQVVALVLLYVFPGIGLWLPNVLYK